MVSIGKFSILDVVALTPQGAYINAEQFGEILLPSRLTPENCHVGDKIKVFIYHDSAERIIATTVKPYVQVGQFASLQVTQVNKIGAFLDWGLPKDLLVPFNQQHSRMQVGKHYLVHVFLDLKTQRLVASSKLDKFIDIWPADYQPWDNVKLTIAKKTELGFKAIINDQHWGLLYENEIFKPLKLGQTLSGFIKQVRADGLIDLSLSRSGEGKVKDFKNILLKHLEENNGFSPLNDKSDPALIKQLLGVSKKTFKATVGHLLKQGKIRIEKNGITLTR